MQNNSIPLDMLNTTLALSHYILQHGGVDTLKAAPARLNDQRNRTAGPATMKYTQKQGHGCCTSGTMWMWTGEQTIIPTRQYLGREWP